MKILGLTGSIASGKSTTADMFRRLKIPVHDADAAVHRLLAKGGKAVDAVAAVFPEALQDGAIARDKLGKMVFQQPEKLARLEAILHPMVRAETARFLKLCAARRARLVVLDIPLLFETGGERRVDAVLSVLCSPILQQQRALRRSGMGVAKYRAIRAKQVSDSVRRRKSDLVLYSNLGRSVVQRAVTMLVYREISLAEVAHHARNRSGY